MKRILLIALAYNIGFNVVLAGTGKGDGETRTATVTKEVSANDLINIQAKYTDLVIESWDKNQVEIVATVRFDGRMTDKMQEFLDDFQQTVEENIYSSAGELKIDTDLEPNKVQIGSKKLGITIGFSDDEFRLEYQIKAPGTNDFEINTSYRDTELVGRFEKMKFTQYSGELNADFIQKADMNLKYGSATVEGMGTAKMEIYEQEFDTQSIDELEINAKYSDLELGDVGRLDAISYESDFQFDKLDYLSGNYKYGDIEVSEWVKEAELEFYEMEIDFRSIEILNFKQSKYGNYSIDEVGELTFDQSYEDKIEIGTLGKLKSTNSKYADYKIDLLQSTLELSAYEDDIVIDDVADSATEISFDGKYIKARLGAEDLSFNLSGKVKYGKIDYNESNVEVRRYIKDSDELEIEVQSKKKKDNPLIIQVNGYEVDVFIE